jgi:Spy/CpxP family protein refolding chaperone
MYRRGVVCLVVLAALAAGKIFVDAQDQPLRGRGRLPPLWSRLGLTDEQKQKVYQVQGEYAAKIDGLQRQIDDLRRKERADMEKVLTNAQKARLRELLTGRAPAETPAKDDKPERKP